MLLQAGHGNGRADGPTAAAEREQSMMRVKVGEKVAAQKQMGVCQYGVQQLGPVSDGCFYKTMDAVMGSAAAPAALPLRPAARDAAGRIVAPSTPPSALVGWRCSVT